MRPQCLAPGFGHRSSPVRHVGMTRERKVRVPGERPLAGLARFGGNRFREWLRQENTASQIDISGNSDVGSHQLHPNRTNLCPQRARKEMDGPKNWRSLRATIRRPGSVCWAVLENTVAEGKYL